MRAVGAKNTAPEMIVRRELHAAGFRYLIHAKQLPGSPDIALPKYKAAIFVDGCFWHGHECALFKVPKTRTDFWLGKITANKQRDSLNDSLLTDRGWRVLHIWECSLKGSQKLNRADLLERVRAWLVSDRPNGSIP